MAPKQTNHVLHVVARTNPIGKPLVFCIVLLSTLDVVVCCFFSSLSLYSL